MKAYKGFDKDLTCEGLQFEVGETYGKYCLVYPRKIFHAYLAPLDVFKYYAPATSRFCEVKIDGEIEKSTSDSKIVGTRIEIIREISVAEMIKAQRDYEEGKKSRLKKIVMAEDCGAATSEVYGGAIAGYRGVATTGDCGVAIVKDRGVATAGDCGVAMAKYRGVATAGRYGRASAGYYGTAVSRGMSSTGACGLCVARGKGCCVKGGLGAVLIIVEDPDDDMEALCCKTAVVDGEEIKADTWYTLRNGEFSEVDNDIMDGEFSEVDNDIMEDYEDDIDDDED